jgi:hypothetical protein
MTPDDAFKAEIASLRHDMAGTARHVAGYALQSGFT